MSERLGTAAGRATDRAYRHFQGLGQELVLRDLDPVPVLRRIVPAARGSRSDLDALANLGALGGAVLAAHRQWLVRMDLFPPDDLAVGVREGLELYAAERALG